MPTPFQPFLFSLLLLGSTIYAYGQQESRSKAFLRDSLLAIEYANIADTSYQTVDTSLRYYYLAIPLLKKTGQWKEYVRCLAGLSHCYYVKEDYTRMEANNLLAYEEAQKYTQPNSVLYNAVLNNLGKVYGEVRQDYNRAIALYKTALQALDSTETTYHGVKGTVLKNIGEILLKKGDFDNALPYFNEALFHFETAHRDYAFQDNNILFKIPEVYQSLAQLHQYQRNYFQAVCYLEDMLALMDSSNKPFDPKYYVYCYANLAEIALEQKNLPLAASRLGQIARMNALKPQQEAEMHRLYSMFYLAKGNWGLAHKHADRATSLTPPANRINLAAIFHLKGQILFAQTRYESALGYYQQAAAQLITKGSLSADSPVSDPELETLSRMDLIAQLDGMAACFRALFDIKNDPELLKKALNCFLLISSLSDQMRLDYQSEESKIFLSERNFHFYEAGISVAYQLYQLNQQQHWLDQAFYLIEKSKAVVLLEEIREKEAIGVFTIPSELLEEAYRLRVDIRYCQKMLGLEAQNGTNSDEKKSKKWNKKLLKSIQTLEKWEEKINRQFPEYTAFTRREVVEIGALQQKLHDTQTAMIEFFIGAKNSYAFYISKEKIRLIKLPKQEELAPEVEKLLSLLKMEGKTGIEQYQLVAHKLYNTLFGGLEIGGKKKLILIPDDCLSALPFDVLLSAPANHLNPRDFQYLIKTHSISYAYSLSVLQVQQMAKQRKSKILWVAPVFKNDPAKFLAHSNAEMNAFKDLNFDRLSEQGATVGNFLDRAGRYDLIHFHSHATTNDPVLQQPAIDFIDTKLSLSDLYTIRLPAHLIVLSACEAGTGNQRNGEGMMSLARGFAYAGVPSIVSTLWKVNEKTTHQLADHFYTYLSKGFTKDEALRLAKTEFLAHCDDAKTVPHYWAGFIALGNTDPFVFHKKTPLLLTVGSITASSLLLLLFAYWIRRKVLRD